ncbi:hypothetical protein [Azomonas macrocytogenes]|uniref:Uncharacterized protein n=1 Tax=Azomonas macrocytogenes TaxID=69962 RepID=A0A839T7Q5_AZOMA|nr:hypothetical protein [Azomonas macrocytogenes]MBB3105118.1 hypothetical protein [Azomonas macrocytogenes]
MSEQEQNRSTVDQLDARAQALHNQRPDRDLRELDILLWGTLHQLCWGGRESVSERFVVDELAINAISQASIQSISKLASGCLLGFRLVNEGQIIRQLEQVYSPIQLAHTSANQIDEQYWLQLHRLANEDLAHAEIAFGVSPKLARYVARASVCQLRIMSARIPARFALRFDSDTIERILSHSRGMKEARLLRIRLIQQAFRVRRLQ